MALLHDRLTAKAAHERLLDVAYRTIGSPVGTLLLAATPTGLVRVAYEVEGLDRVLEALAAKVSPRVLLAPERLDAAARQIDEYFAGRRHRFELPIDLSLSSGFRRSVLSYLPTIEYGHTASYRDVATAMENPRAVRAVGSACSSNPLPLVLPCHCVIQSSGSPGSYLGGADVKRRLLEMEATG